MADPLRPLVEKCFAQSRNGFFARNALTEDEMRLFNQEHFVMDTGGSFLSFTAAAVNRYKDVFIREPREIAQEIAQRTRT